MPIIFIISAVIHFWSPVALPHGSSALATGSIKGMVTFVGSTPKQEPFKCNVSPDVCGSSVPMDRLVVGKNKGVRYTLIYIKNPPPSTTSNMAPVILNQERCRYSPHMAIAARGSKVTITNNDDVLHNSHGYYYIGSEFTSAFNIAQPIKGQQSTVDVKKQGMINLQCDAGHVWMSAWVWVTANPFAVVTNENGEFSLDGLPPGTYTLVMWHEGWKIKDIQYQRPIFSEPVAQEVEVMVTAGAVTTTNFELR